MFISGKRLRELEIRLDVLEDTCVGLYNSLSAIDDSKFVSKNTIHDVEPCDCGCYVEEGDN